MAFHTLSQFHDRIKIYSAWSIYRSLRQLYDSDVHIHKVSKNWQSWEHIYQMKSKTWLVPEYASDIVDDFKSNILNDVCVDKYEAFVIGKMYLDAIHLENVRRMPLLCGYDSCNLFLQSMNLLYSQKFNVQKVKVLFHELFFDINEPTPEERFDVAYILGHIKYVKPIITAKTKKKYSQYVENYTIVSEIGAITHATSKFTCTDIVTLDEFYSFCKTIYDYSLMYKEKSSKTILLNIFKQIEESKYYNKLNKLFGNILLLALFEIKEENSTYHNKLYSDLELLQKYV
nr:hypothetical protein MmNV_61 [Menippe mercenaria nudivirus]